MVSGSLPCFCSASTTPNPSTSGIWMSRKTRSGFSRSIRAMADFPPPHSATTSRSGSSCSRLRRRPRARASSSLSNTRIDMVGRNLLNSRSIGNADFYATSAARSVCQHHGVIFVVKLAQAAARISQADAFRGNESAAIGEADAVVANFHPDVVAVAPGGDANQAGRAARADAVTDSVLDQRLQDQVRHHCIERPGIDFGFNAQAIVEACLLNVDVFLQESQLPVERDFVHADTIER